MKQLIISIFLISIFATIGCSQKNGTPNNANSDTSTIETYIKGKDYSKYGVATLAGGCFWCTEAAFERIEGVVDVISGYTDGNVAFPTYKAVCTGSTGHTEAIQIYFDKDKIDFATLLDVLFVAHDPTQLNRQGNDVGTQYRSGIYYHSDEQKSIAEAKIKEWNKKGKYRKDIVTEIKKYAEFYVAEEYHQNYYEINPRQSYVYNVSRPKVEKVLKTYPELIKSKYK